MPNHKNQWRNKLKSMTFDVKNTSKKICQNIQNLELFHHAKNIAIFFPSDTEIDLRRFKTHSKKIFLPRYNEEKMGYEFALWDKTPLQKKQFNLYEPSEKQALAKHLDIIFIPALGFDKSFHRLGYGMGFYDKILQEYPKALHIGVHNEKRIIQDNFPHEPWDQRMDIIITEKNIYIHDS